MIIRFSTKNDRNGNRYQLLVDTDKKTYKRGYYLFMSCDIHTSKQDIQDFIKYNLVGFTEEY